MSSNPETLHNWSPVTHVKKEKKEKKIVIKTLKPQLSYIFPQVSCDFA